MTFRRETKIVFIILGLLLVVAVVFIIAQYPKAKATKATQDEYLSAKQSQPPGTCAPNSSECNGDAKLCMEMNKNLSCN